jgi:hypothetical protein
MCDILRGIELDEARFLSLLEKLIGDADKVQNMPPNHVPQEHIMVGYVMEVLAPFSVRNFSNKPFFMTRRMTTFLATAEIETLDRAILI